MKMFSQSKKSMCIASIALLVAIIGVLIGLAAYFKSRRDLYLFDEEDDFLFEDPDDLDYYDAEPEEKEEAKPAPVEGE